MTTPADLEALKRYLGLSGAKTAEALGIDRDRFYDMLAGRSPIPRYVAMAASAAAFGLGPWPATFSGHVDRIIASTK